MPKNKVVDALQYHQMGRPGKIEVVPTKPTQTQRDLSLAYSPGVAEPCLRIAENNEEVFNYTAKGNLVGVISNGTAVLGLGDIGPEASKPVMEGKGILFKIFADIDVFDIELNAKTADEVISAVKALEPTFGGINLEDIKAPECFEIEERLKKELNIPVMHDDQHGTAIISGAALINALQIVNKPIEEVKMVINGAGASAISCGKLFVSLGLKKENIVMCDSKGVIRSDREYLDKYKSFFATTRGLNTLGDAMVDADVFVGLSKGNILSPDMLLSMAEKPIVFAMANPDPEISYDLAVATRKDIIMATGRSDFPNQVNNVLGFPFIFRGALDVRATAINEEMKLAAVKAIAELAHEPVPEIVTKAYNLKSVGFGHDYIIPKPIDPRLITHVAPAVAKAAIESGVARREITNWDEYREELRKRLGLDNKLLRTISIKAKRNPQRVVFAEADNAKILRAAQIVKEEGTAIPILLGSKEKIQSIMNELNIELGETTIINPMEEKELRNQFGQVYFEQRQRKGITYYDACKSMRDRNFFGPMMVNMGMADAFVSGLTKNYPNTVRPALRIVGKQDGVKRVAGMYIIMSKRGPMFFADTTININPDWEALAEITVLAHDFVKSMNIEPRIAMLSFNNFGNTKDDTPEKIQKAVTWLHQNRPEIVVDGEMQANFALNSSLRQEVFPFTKLGDQDVNTFIFPNLAAGNIAYKFAQELGAAESIGPVLLGFRKSVHILQLGSSVREIVNMINIAAVDAQDKS